MIKYIVLLILFPLSSLIAQGKYWIFFKDKNTKFEPYEYFDYKAIERRINQNISLIDSTDFPVNDKYIKIISGLVDSTKFVTRWFNGMCVFAKESQILQIKKLNFISKIEQIQSQVYVASNKYEDNNFLDDEELELAKKQTAIFGNNYFIKNNFNGKGIRIAIFDGGFPNVDNHPAFEHIRNENRIIETYDFARNKKNVYGYNAHGTMVLSCIAGIIDSIQLGLATQAEFLLARTEINTEPFSEEENWLAAVEWADKNGADIINSSLGYTTNRYFPKQMDGKTSLVSRAANLAAKKGILVVNAAGNEGDNSWNFIGTPADADSVLSIGGIDPKTNYHISFSSYGPTADKRLKPNVCAYGHAVVASKSGVTEADGTSFSSPLVAGFAACAWQSNRSLTNMKLFKEIEKSSNLYPYFDYAHGYGVPQAKYFTEKCLVNPDTTFNIMVTNNEIKVNIRPQSFSNNENNKYESNTKYLYYNIQDETGFIKKFFVIEVNSFNVLQLIKSEFEVGTRINIFYNGYMQTIII